MATQFADTQWTFFGHEDSLNDVEQTSGGAFVSASSDTTVRHFTPTAGGGVTTNWTFSGHNPDFGSVLDVEQTSGGAFVSGGIDGTVQHFTPTSAGSVTTDWVFAENDDITDVEQASDGSFVAATQGNTTRIQQFTPTESGAIDVRGTFSGHNDDVEAVEQTFGGNFVSASVDGTVRLISPERGITTEWIFSGHNGPVEDVEQTSGGGFVSASQDGTVRHLTSTAGGGVTADWTFSVNGTGFADVEQTAGGGFVAADFFNQAVRHFTATSDGSVNTNWVFSGHGAAVVNVEQTSGGDFVSASQDETVRKFSPPDRAADPLPPAARDDSTNTTAGNTVTIDVLANDSAPDGTTLTLQDASGANNGNVSVTSDGQVRYAPDSGFTGQDTLTYTVVASNGISASATANVNVQSRDDMSDTNLLGKTITTQVFEGNRSNPITNQIDRTVQSNATELPNLEQFGDTGPIFVNFTQNQIVTGVLSSSSGAKDVAPEDQFEGLVFTDSQGTIEPFQNVSIASSDVSRSNLSLTTTDDEIALNTRNARIEPGETITINVGTGSNAPGDGDDNQAPTAADDSTNTTAGNTVTIDVLSNDSDPDGDALTVQAVGDPANGQAEITDGGEIRYTPDNGFTGTNSFTYTVADGNGGTSSANVAVTVQDDGQSSANPPRSEDLNVVVLNGDSQTLKVPFAADIRGTSAAETVQVAPTATVAFGGNTGDEVEFADSIADYSFTQSGNVLTVDGPSGERAEIALNADTEVEFADGSATATLAVAGSISMEIGGETVGPNFDPADVALDGNDVSALATSPDTGDVSAA